LVSIKESTKLSEHTLHTQSCRNIHFTHEAVGTYPHLERQVPQRIYEFLGWLYFSFSTNCSQCVEQNDIYFALMRNFRKIKQLKNIKYKGYQQMPLSFVIFLYLYVSTLHVSGLYQPIIKGIPSCCLFVATWFM